MKYLKIEYRLLVYFPTLTVDIKKESSENENEKESSENDQSAGHFQSFFSSPPPPPTLNLKKIPLIS